MRTSLKWLVVALNLAAIILLIGLRQYAHGYHDADVADAYQGLVSRGLLDESKAEAYARDHHGWNPKDRLHSIGDPDGFVQDVFVVGVIACIGNTAAILFLSRKRDDLSA
jgi:hypothetical protein